MKLQALLTALLTICTAACADPPPPPLACGDKRVSSCNVCPQAPLECAKRERCVADCAECPGSTDCGVAWCAYTDTDPLHCGGCDMPCGPGEVCEESSCWCAVGFADCNGNAADGCEIDTFADERHCGNCGLDCGPGYRCCDGRCRYIEADPDHCGGCFRGCLSFEYCLARECESDS